MLKAPGKHLLLVLVVLPILLCGPATAGDAWVAVGAGGGSKGFAVLANASIQVREHGFLTVRFAGTWEISKVNESRLYTRSSAFYPGVRDAGLLLGVITARDEPGRSLSLAVGAGWVMSTEKGDGETGLPSRPDIEQERETAAGILLQSGLFWKALGIQAFANFNSVQSFGGLVFSLRLLHEGD